jgi:hypothetical protein
MSLRVSPEYPARAERSSVAFLATFCAPEAPPRHPSWNAHARVLHFGESFACMLREAHDGVSGRSH